MTRTDIERTYTYYDEKIKSLVNILSAAYKETIDIDTEICERQLKMCLCERDKYKEMLEG